MFCKKCGKELTEDEKFCSQCGTSVAEQPTSNNPNNNISNNKKIKKKSSGGIVVIAIIAILLLFYFVGKTISSTANNITSSIPINTILDVNSFYKTANKTISTNELISLYGNPEKQEKWNYTRADQTKIPLTTLYYENSTYEYIFHDDMLVRININKNIEFNSQNDIFYMFNLSKHDITQIKNTGSAIRIFNSSVPDFWCGINEKNIEWIKITFISDIFE